MRTNDPTTPLLKILRDLETDDRRDEFAALAGTSRGYLYQLASCARCAPRARLALALVNASAEMHEKYGTDQISLQELATMCPSK